MKYVVVIEKGESSYGAHVPDLPGCIAVGDSKEEVLELIREAIEFHIDGLKADGEPVPSPHRTLNSLRWSPPNKALQPTPESAPAPSADPFRAGAAELGRWAAT